MIFRLHWHASSTQYGRFVTGATLVIARGLVETLFQIKKSPFHLKKTFCGFVSVMFRLHWHASFAQHDNVE